jgi:hypothetical protein
VRYVDTWWRRGGDWAVDRSDCIIDFDANSEVTPLGRNERSRRDETDLSYAAVRVAK